MSKQQQNEISDWSLTSAREHVGNQIVQAIYKHGPMRLKHVARLHDNIVGLRSTMAEKRQWAAFYLQMLNQGERLFQKNGFWSLPSSQPVQTEETVQA